MNRVVNVILGLYLAEGNIHIELANLNDKE